MIITRERKKIKTKKKEKISWIGYTAILVTILVFMMIIVSLFGNFVPSDQSQLNDNSTEYEEYTNINRKVSVSAFHVTQDIFNCELPGFCEKMDARTKINVTTINSTGKLSLYVNDMLVGDNMSIDHIGSYDLGCYCGCIIPGCNCYVYPGNNSVEIISYGFEGNLIYNITIFQSVDV